MQLFHFALLIIFKISITKITIINNKSFYQLPQIEDRASIVPLVAGLRKEVLNLISEGFGLVWESYKVDQYVLRLSECVTQFQEKVIIFIYK